MVVGIDEELGTRAIEAVKEFRFRRALDNLLRTMEWLYWNQMTMQEHIEWDRWLGLQD